MPDRTLKVFAEGCCGEILYVYECTFCDPMHTSDRYATEAQATEAASRHDHEFHLSYR